MPVLIGIAVILVFGVVYPFVHAHPVVIFAALGVIVLIIWGTLSFVVGLSRRHVVHRSPPKALPSPPSRHMPEPIEAPLFRQPEPAPVPAAVIPEPVPVGDHGECDLDRCRKSLADGAWELEVVDTDPFGKPVRHQRKFCSRRCLQQWQASYETSRA